MMEKDVKADDEDDVDEMTITVRAIGEKRLISRACPHGV